MEKTWFIFQSDHHLGPFSTQEIFELLNNEKIDEQTPLWREGVEDWYPLSRFEEFFPVEEDLPEVPIIEELPELPDFPSLPEEEIEEEQEEVFNDVVEETIEAMEEEVSIPSIPELPELPTEIEAIAPETPLVPVEDEEISSADIPDVPSIPLEEIVDVIEAEESGPTLESIVTSEVEESETFQDDDLEIDNISEVGDTEEDSAPWAEIEEQTQRKPLNYKFISAVASCFIILILSGYLIYRSAQSYVNLDDFSAITIEKVEEIRSTPFESNVHADIFMSKDTKDLMLAANISHKSKVYLTLSSVQNRVLSSEKVVATATGTLTNGVARFSEVKIVKGSRFASGDYYVQLLAIPVGVEQRVYKYLHEKLGLSFFRPAGQLRFRGKSLIFPGTRDDFNKNLDHFKKNTLTKKTRPLEHLVEGYKTFATLSSKIYKTYEEVLTSIRRGKEIESFEILYSKRIGPVLQGLILETHKTSKEYEISDPQMYGLFQELLEQGKRIGEMSSDMVTMTKRIKRLRKKSRNRLMKLFVKRSLFLQETSKTKVKEIEKKLKNIKL